ncbi:MAG: endonuclease [Cruoricaptor ignavus]|nr:endonuclease [Cruoricaptor ignavus]
MIFFYNVENLFPPDIRNKKPVSGLRNWNEERYQQKLNNIVKVLELLKQEKKEFPTLIGLCEVQGEKPILDLLENDIFNHSFGFVHYDSMDERGMDVALLYDKSKVEILSSETISFLFEIDDKNPENYDTTRDVLHCKVKYENTIIHIFILHLPSKRELNINKPKREFILNEVKKKIGIINSESVVVMGDFNENPDSEMMQNFVHHTENELRLINPFLDIFKSRGFSTFHQKTGLLFDQIILSEDFFQTKENALSFVSAGVFNHQKISNFDRRFFGRPYRTYVGTRYLGGFSDHFPVIVQLKKNRLL